MRYRSSWFLEILIRVFLVGLLVQFFLQTFVTYTLHLTGSFRDGIWLWKEACILIFVGFVGYGLWKHVQNNANLTRKSLRSDALFSFFVTFLILGVLSFIIAIGIQRGGIGSYILSFKYDFLGFFIFLLGVGLVWYFPLKCTSFTRWYYMLLKLVVIGGFLWWGMLYFVPDMLNLAGYSTQVFDGILGGNPPAIYYTQIDKGFIRNQFLFERPISLGFFLIAFWPLFALGYLRKQTKKYQFFWTIAFGVLVFSTHSRAALAVWLLQTGIIVLFLYRKYLKKLMWIGIPCFFVILGGAWHFRSLFVREHSTTGHLVLLQEGIKLGLRNPFFGWGVGYAGPASHQICFSHQDDPRCQEIKAINTYHQIKTYGYNPENQYVQIFMEYGFLGLLPWLICFGWFLYITLKTIKALILEFARGKKADQKYISQLFILIGFGLGLFGLAVEGVVLHSFVDRMIVYPFMLLFGLYYGKVSKPDALRD